jgi:uncharacterized protein HemY
MTDLGRLLIVFGLVIVGIGLLLTFAGRIPGISWLGHLPGDVYIRRDNFRFYFPITTSILASVLLTLLLYLLRR